jgi:ketosteroid isomerase-like protein
MSRLSSMAAILAVLFLVPSTTGGAARAKTDGVAEVRKLVEAWDAALRRNDVDFISGILDSEFTYIAADGRILSKKELLDGIRAMGKLSLSESDVTSIRSYGDVVIVVATGRSQRLQGGRTSTDLYRFTDIWVRKGRAWKAVLTQATPLKDALEKGKGQ